MRLNQQDLDALREGIREQERAAAQQEQIQRSFELRLARESAPEVELRRAGALRVGDVLCATDNGRNFYKDAEVTSIKRTPGSSYDVWMDFDFADGGRGGHAFSENALVLVARRS